ncbi:hypothetical protein AZH51_09250 [Branchiibius sp. NY16-3462-2]|nr:hypothetical protein AZH51_09250 [Branchiibius sp. NY16-3462-2]
MAMVTAITGVAELIRDFGLSSAAIQATELSDDERTNLLWINTGIGAACAVVVACSAPLLVALYGNPKVGPIVLVLAGLFVISGFNTQFWANLSRSLRFNALALTGITAQTVAVCTSITMALLGFGYWSIVGQQSALVITSCVMNVFQSRWRPGLYRRAVSVRRFFRFGGGVLGVQLLGYATNNVDSIALGAVWGAGLVGLYSRAYQLMMVPMQQINDTMARVTLPVLSRVHEQQAVYVRYIQGSQLIGCYFLATCFAMAAGMAHPLVLTLFGARWDAVTPIFIAIAIGGMFRGIGQVSYWMFLSRGKTGEQLRLFLVLGPLMVVLLLAGLPWGPIGVAIGHSVGHLTYWLVSLWRAGDVVGVPRAPLFWQATRSIFLVSGPAGLAAAGGQLVVASPLAQIGLGLVFSAAYLIAITTFSPTERRNVQMITDRLGLARLLRRGRSTGPAPEPQPAPFDPLILLDPESPQTTQQTDPASQLALRVNTEGPITGDDAPHGTNRGSHHDGHPSNS